MSNGRKNAHTAPTKEIPAYTISERNIEYFDRTCKERDNGNVVTNKLYQYPGIDQYKVRFFFVNCY